MKTEKKRKNNKTAAQMINYKPRLLAEGNWIFPTLLLTLFYLFFPLFFILFFHVFRDTVFVFMTLFSSLFSSVLLFSCCFSCSCFSERKGIFSLALV